MPAALRRAAANIAETQTRERWQRRDVRQRSARPRAARAAPERRPRPPCASLGRGQSAPIRAPQSHSLSRGGQWNSSRRRRGQCSSVSVVTSPSTRLAQRLLRRIATNPYPRVNEVLHGGKPGDTEAPIAGSGAAAEVGRPGETPPGHKADSARWCTPSPSPVRGTHSGDAARLTTSVASELAAWANGPLDGRTSDGRS